MGGTVSGARQATTTVTLSEPTNLYSRTFPYIHRRCTASAHLGNRKLNPMTPGWRPLHLSLKKKTDKLERVQTRAVRFNYSEFRRLNSPSPPTQMNNIELLQEQSKISKLRFLFVLTNDKLSINCNAYLKHITARQTRHHQPHDVTPHFARTNLFKFVFQG